MPARLIGSRVRVMLSANELRVFDGPALAAIHPRVLPGQLPDQLTDLLRDRRAPGGTG